MSASDAASVGFDAFRERVYGDLALQVRLASVTDPATFVTIVVATAAELGQTLSATDVTEALRAGHIGWLTCGCEIV